MDSERSKPSVPKFASFRPKAPSAAPGSASTEPLSASHGHGRHVPQARLSAERQSYENGGDSNSEYGGSKAEDARLSRRQHHHRDAHRDERRHRRKHHEPGRGQRHDRSSPRRSPDHDVAIAPEPLAVPWHEDVELFTVDKRGDVANLTYGGLHKYSIPPYRRVGYGSVLGLPADSKIDRSLTTDKAIVISDDRANAKRERYLLAKPGKRDERTLRMIIPSRQEDGTLHEQQFVPFQSGRKRKRGSETPGASGAEVDYRSIEGKAKPSRKAQSDSDLEYASDSSGAGRENLQDAEHRARQKNAELSRRAKTEGSVEAWLDLIEHQEIMIRLGEGATDASLHPYAPSELSNSQQQALADIRISMYEEALRKISPTQRHRVRLLLGLMEESSKVQEPRKLAIQWQAIMKQNAATPSTSDNLELWMKYLNFVQTTFVDFKYDACRKTFEECLATLAESYAQLQLDDIPTAERPQRRQLQDQIAEALLYVILRLTAMMREAGYHERATALWQALLEYHLVRPRDLVQMSKQELLAAFEDFWESEVPRIGEHAWQGWNAFHELGGAAPEPAVIPLDTHIDPDNCFADFATKEEAHMQALQQPGRIGDEAGEDDPYHTILFSDLKDYLAWLPTRIAPLMLVQAFLRFCHMPPLPHREQNIVQWWLDAFLRNGHSAGHAAHASMQYFQNTTDRLFSNLTADGLSPEWLQQVLKGLAYAVEDDLMAEYYLAFEFTHFPSSAAKAAKALLKKRPNSLWLYNSYALIETRAGNVSAADRVFSTAISMSKTLPETARRDVILLWHTWTWEALRSGGVLAAVQRIFTIADQRPTVPAADTVKGALSISPATLLKVRTTLSEGRDAYLLDPQYYYLGVLYADLLALLGYLGQSSNPSIEAALQSYSESLESLTTRTAASSAIETLHQYRTNLLMFHVSNSKAYQPSVIRSVLSESIALFPNNTIFLEAFAATEARFRIDDRVRSALSTHTLKEEEATVVGWSFAISNEMKRPVHLGTTVHSVRRLFDRAVNSKSGRNSAALWTWYVRWELQTGGDLARAKEVFLRGLTHLPWCKAFMMLAFKLLRDAMGFEELRRVYNVMVEKELRVHVDLGECFQGRAEKTRGSLRHD